MGTQPSMIEKIALTALRACNVDISPFPQPRSCENRSYFPLPSSIPSRVVTLNILMYCIQSSLGIQNLLRTQNLKSRCAHQLDLNALMPCTWISKKSSESEFSTTGGTWISPASPFVNETGTRTMARSPRLRYFKATCQPGMT